MNIDNLFKILVRLIVLFTVLPIHEFAHGYVAYRLGDPTARDAGRLTLNPFKHLDFLGSVMMLLLGFGYAKPVPVSGYNFRKPKRDFALVALAGPMSNLIMAFICMIMVKLIVLFARATLSTSILLFAVFEMLQIATQINITLAVFNLFPIPPLDGSRLVTALLPDRAYMFFLRNERYIMLGLFVLIFLGVLDTPIYFLSNKIYNLLYTLTKFIPI